MRYDILFVEPLRDMMLRVFAFIPTLLLALAILIVGYVFAHAIERLITRLFKILELDKAADKTGLTHILRNGGVKEKPSELVGVLTYWVLMITFLIMSVKIVGLTAVSGLLDSILAFLPNVIGGVLVLMIGMLVAKVISSLVYVVAKTTDMPFPETISRLSKYAIIVFAGILFLKEIGFVSLFEGEHYTIFIGGVVFAVALAFGLAGKDIAARYLDVLNIKRLGEHHKA
jgi:hypothetical protein